MSDPFSSIAHIYRQTATAQKSAAERLFWMLRIERTDDVLDLGCGTGHLAQEIRLLTDGRVVGIDRSPQMIALAREAAPDGIELVTGAAEDLDMPAQFDAIFCNSAFQWFTDEARALANCYAALRPGGRMVMQAPARREYCPNFIHAVATFADDPRTAETWSRFRTPWTFYETAEEYERLFSDAGFALVGGEIEELREHCTPSRALDMFDSGAAAAYLNPACYDVEMPDGYIDAARELVLADLRAQAGRKRRLEVVFNRVYVLARRP
ncbi:MAG TPA: methyltransferase domain-containing protein [Thermoleophilia bacterium]|nr:methyltransferase domain-containing protein [Thermoleophilia bacterium]